MVGALGEVLVLQILKDGWIVRVKKIIYSIIISARYYYYYWKVKEVTNEFMKRKEDTINIDTKINILQTKWRGSLHISIRVALALVKRTL